MLTKELETKHQLLEEKRELERELKRRAFEKNYVRSQSNSARDKSPFNPITKTRDISNWASRIDNLLTPNRSTVRFEVIPEVIRPSHFSRYDSSRDQSSSVEDQTCPPELVFYDTRVDAQVAKVYQS